MGQQNSLGHGVAKRRAEQNAVVDLDLKCIDRERDVIIGTERKAGAHVHRLLGLQRLGVEQSRRAVGHRHDEHVRHHAADDVRIHATEMRLGQSRRPEPGAEGGARRELARGLQADRGLAGRQRAEVGVVLEPPRDVREELGRQIGFEIGVHRRIRAVRIRLVLRPEAGEDLRVRATGRAIRAEVMAVDVGCKLAARDLIAFTPERGTDGHVDRLAQAEADRFGGVQAHEHLVAPEPARKKRRLIGHVVGGAQRAVRARGARIGRVEARTERDVQGVPDVIIEPVAAVGGAEVDRPAACDRPDPGDDRIVQHVRRELREVAEGVDLRPVAALNEARAVHGAAPIAVARAFAIAPAAEAVKLRGALVVQR